MYLIMHPFSESQDSTALQHRLYTREQATCRIKVRAVESIHKSSDCDSDPSIFKTSDSDSSIFKTPDSDSESDYFIKAQYVSITVNL
jgi:hypothetical protein